MQSSNTPGISNTFAPLPNGWESCCPVTFLWGSKTADLTRGLRKDAYNAAAADVSPVDAHIANTSDRYPFCNKK